MVDSIKRDNMAKMPIWLQCVCSKTNKMAILDNSVAKSTKATKTFCCKDACYPKRFRRQ